MSKEEIVWNDLQYVIIRRTPSFRDLLQTKLRKPSTHEKLRWLAVPFWILGVYSFG